MYLEAHSYNKKQTSGTLISILVKLKFKKVLFLDKKDSRAFIVAQIKKVLLRKISSHKRVLRGC